MFFGNSMDDLEKQKTLRLLNLNLFSFVLAARGAPYAKARTHFSRDIQLTRHHNNFGKTSTAAENGPILLS